MTIDHLLFIGIAGKVLALDRVTGRETWRTDLTNSDFVNLTLDCGDLYAAAEGELYCLDPATGQIRWHNKLKGLGRGPIAIAQAGSQQSLLAAEQRRQDEAASLTACV
jgi:outer membrane protein assembly factor BamB